MLANASSKLLLACLPAPFLESKLETHFPPAAPDYFLNRGIFVTALFSLSEAVFIRSLRTL
jgi:hypothetical protein